MTIRNLVGIALAVLVVSGIAGALWSVERKNATELRHKGTKTYRNYQLLLPTLNLLCRNKLIVVLAIIVVALILIPVVAKWWALLMAS
jgi:hypothetical protein